MGEKCVKPIILKYSVGSCSAAWGANDFLPLVFINLSWICGMSVEVHVLSDFEPNEYLFTQHASQGKDRWEVFAWAVRDSMARVGNLK